MEEKEFYSYSNSKYRHKYQIAEITTVPVMAFISKSRNSIWHNYPSRDSEVKEISRPANNQDYQQAFVKKVITLNPPYEMNDFLDYHMNSFSEKGYDTETFLKHIRYVILPRIKKDVLIELIEEWLESKGVILKSRMEKVSNQVNILGGVHAPTMVQNGSITSSQNQINNITGESVKDFFEKLKKDVELLTPEYEDYKQDIRSQIEVSLRQIDRGKDIKPFLTTIGGLMKDVGLNVFANVLASPIYESIKPFLGL